MITIPMVKIIFSTAKGLNECYYIKKLEQYRLLIRAREFKEYRLDLTRYALNEVNKEFRTNFKCKKEEDADLELYNAESYLNGLIKQETKNICDSAVEEVVNRASNGYIIN